MTYCYELESGCCGASVRSTVCIGLCHYMFFGVFVVCFVFTNFCYPPFSYPDYIFGGSGAALAILSFLTACTVDLKQFQCLRAFMALLTILAVLATVGSCYYYTVTRWNDVIVTFITRMIRPISKQDCPDRSWFVLALAACICAPIMLFYIPYISSFLCNKWKSHLFTTPYMNDVAFSSLPPTLTVPRATYSANTYKPYPVQRN